MPKNIMCKNCNNLKNHWCEMVVDSPDEDMIRDCRLFWEKTNADRIRAMTDEELAKILYYGFDYRYCNNDPACIALLDTEGGVPEEKCIGCALKWLKQPWEGDYGEG